MTPADSLDDLEAVGMCPWPYGRGCGRLAGHEGAHNANIRERLSPAEQERAELIARLRKSEAAVEAVRAVAIGEDTEEWVRRAGGARMVSGASILEALDETLNTHLGDTP